MSELGLKPELTFHALGAPWQIDLANPIDKQTKTKILQLVADFDATFSRFREDSLVTKLKLAKIGQEIIFPDYVKPLFALYDALFYATKGRIDPCVGAALEILGYTQDVHFEISKNGKLIDINYPISLPNLSEQLQNNQTIKHTQSELMTPGQISTSQLFTLDLSTPQSYTSQSSTSKVSISKYSSNSEQLSKSTQIVNSQQSTNLAHYQNRLLNWKQLRQYSRINALEGEPENTLVCLAPGISLDFGAVGKGFLIDLIANLLQNSGYDEFVVDASGDFRVHLPEAKRPLRIALEDPAQPGFAIGVTEVRTGTFCSSGITRRRWKDATGKLIRHHLLNALSGESTTGVLGVWVAVGEINQTNSANAESNQDNQSTNTSRNTSKKPVPFPYISALCDGIATALFSTDAADLQQIFDFEYLLLDSNRRAHVSSGFLAQ